MALGRFVLRRNFEGKLSKKHLVRKVDWRKVCKLFHGWGEEWFTNYDEETEIARIMSKRRVAYWVKKEEIMRKDVQDLCLKASNIYQSVPTIWRMVNAEILKENSPRSI